MTDLTINRFVMGWSLLILALVLLILQVAVFIPSPFELHIL